MWFITLQYRMLALHLVLPRLKRRTTITLVIWAKSIRIQETYRGMQFQSGWKVCEWVNIQLGNYSLSLVLNFLQPYSRESLMAIPEFLMATFGQKVWLLGEQMQHFILEKWISPSESKVKKNQSSYVSYETFLWEILEWSHFVGRWREGVVWAWHVLSTKYMVRDSNFYPFQPPRWSYSGFTTAGKENL